MFCKILDILKIFSILLEMSKKNKILRRCVFIIFFTNTIIGTVIYLKTGVIKLLIRTYANK